MTGGNNRPLILVTNDDGYKAKGIQKLSEIAAAYGDVVLLAASESQSGRSQAITIKEPLRYKLLEQREGFTKYVVRGTPADGVKLALCHILDRTPNLVLSGINHGSNASSSIVYSGTMGAAIEGALHEIPSIGFSLLDYSPDADFDSSSFYVGQIIEMVLRQGLPRGICLNVNIPALPADNLKGIKICRMANGYWKEDFQERQDPMGGKYYWLTGSYINREPEAEDTDEFVLKQGYVSLVPVNIDFTAYEIMDQLRPLETVIKDEVKN